MAAAILFLAFWLLGYALMRWIPRLSFGVRSPKRPLSTVRLLFNFACALGLFLAVFALHPNAQFISRMELTAGPWGKVLFLSIGVLFGAFWLSSVGLLAVRRRSIPVVHIALTLGMALCIIAAFAPLEGRARMLIAVLYMIVVWHYFVRPLSLVKAWSALALGLLIALTLDYLRLTSDYAHIDPLQMAFGLAYGRQFDGIMNLAAVMRGVEEGYAQHHHGRAWIADVLNDLGVRFGHPDSRTMFMSDVLRMPRYQAGFPLTRPGEFFLAFGWPGIALGGAALGALTRLWYNWVIGTRPFGTASVPIYFTLLMTASLVTQKNYLFSSLVMAVTYAVLIFALGWLAYGYQLVTMRRVAAARPRSVARPT
jgi:hypothetical protein